MSVFNLSLSLDSETEAQAKRRVYWNHSVGWLRMHELLLNQRSDMFEVFVIHTKKIMEANLKMIQLQAANLAAQEKQKKGHSKKKDAMSLMIGGSTPSQGASQNLPSQTAGTASQLKDHEKSFYNGMASSGPSSPSRKAGGL